MLGKTLVSRVPQLGLEERRSFAYTTEKGFYEVPRLELAGVNFRIEHGDLFS